MISTLHNNQEIIHLSITTKLGISNNRDVIIALHRDGCNRMVMSQDQDIFTFYWLGLGTYWIPPREDRRSHLDTSPCLIAVKFLRVWGYYLLLLVITLSRGTEEPLGVGEVVRIPAGCDEHWGVPGDVRDTLHLDLGALQQEGKLDFTTLLFLPIMRCTFLNDLNG